MANNRQTTKGRGKQVVLSEPGKIFLERYLTAKGWKLVESGQLTREEADLKYGKNRYITNVNAVPVKIIDHQK